MLPYCTCAPCIRTDKQNYNIDLYTERGEISSEMREMILKSKIIIIILMMKKSQELPVFVGQQK